MITEPELDKCFWEVFSTNEQFQKALLEHTKFKDLTLKLQMNELWHSRWYTNPETKKQSETDITLFLKKLYVRNATRFTLKISHHIVHGSLIRRRITAHVLNALQRSGSMRTVPSV